MILKSFRISNFRCFGDEVQFIFKPPQKKRNVYLIGGMNGQGKTTFLEALKVCLFGIEILPDSERNNIKNRKKPIHGTKLILDFDHNDRSWTIERSLGDGENSLHLSIKGEEDDNQPRKYSDEDAQLEIYNVFPRRLCDFFLFDGEEIKSFAEKTDQEAMQTLKNDIDTLLGLDVFKKLKADFDHLRNRQFKSENDFDSIQNEISENEGMLSAAREKIRITESEIQKLKENLEPIQKIIKEIQSEYDTISLNDNQLNRLLEKQAKLKSEKESLTESIEKFVKQVAPYALIAKELNAICRSYSDQDSNRFNSIIKEKLNSLDKKLSDSGRCLCGHFLPSDEIREVIQELRQALMDDIEANESELILPELTKERYSVLKSHLNDFSREKPISEQLERLSEIENELYNVGENIRKVESSLTEKSRNTMIVYQEKTDEKGNIETDIREKQAELASFKETERKLNKSLEETYSKLKLEDRKSKIQSKMFAITKVVETVMDRIRDEKLKDIEKNVTQLFRSLWEKKDILEKVKIDPNSFSSSVIKTDGSEIKKSELSAGEKELFALSILGGLAKSSGSDLPVVIDTPLSRLDSQHRHHIAVSYYPHASRQVLLLSTDTEITEDLYQLLNPHIRQKLTLEHDEYEQQTTIRNGFFELSGD